MVGYAVDAKSERETSKSNICVVAVLLLEDQQHDDDDNDYDGHNCRPILISNFYPKSNNRFGVSANGSVCNSSVRG